MLKNKNRIFAEMIKESNYDLVVSTRISDDQIKLLEKNIFEKGFVSYSGKDENGNLINGKLVKIQNTKNEVFLYIKLNRGDEDGEEGTTI